MRKENSEFKIDFLSQPGELVLHNNDYYGCSELDEFACYVVADGFRSGNDKLEDPSARLAVEAVITAFHAKPSMRKGYLAKYLKAAHKALLDNKGKERCRASITVVVTNYQKLRYGFAGNCRFNLYRSGKLLEESHDQSLSWDMVERGELPKDKIAYHAERNNLKNYCGIQGAFRPVISKVIKLSNADIFSLFTQGIWENAPVDQMLAAVLTAENDPKEATFYLERLLMDKMPADRSLENYTVCFVFVDKVYLDPNESKRRRRIIIFSIIAVLLIAIIIVAAILYSNWRARMRDDMQTAYNNSIMLIQGYNFVRAKEELQTANELAEKLRDKEMINDTNDYMMFVEAVDKADSEFDKGSYKDAVLLYGAAINKSKYADNLALSYIESRRETAAGHLDVHEYIYLGDSLVDIEDWSRAEAKYLEARNLASRLFYPEGRELANQALDAMYQLMEKETEEQKDSAGEEVAAAEYIIEGDKALRDGDLTAALLYYQLASDKYTALKNEPIVAAIDRKIELADAKIIENESRLESAAIYVKVGDELYELGQYVETKRNYLLARDIYADLGYEEELKEVQTKIELVDLYLMDASKQEPVSAPTVENNNEQNGIDSDG